MNDILNQIQYIQQHSNKITPSMEMLLWAVYGDLNTIVEEERQKHQIELDKIPSDNDLINQGNWWCVTDYDEHHIMVRVGSKGSVTGIDYYQSMDWINNVPTIKNVDDLARDIWMVYNGIQLTPVPTIREMIISVRGCY